jgi:hypothetical protein
LSWLSNRLPRLSRLLLLGAAISPIWWPATPVAGRTLTVPAEYATIKAAMAAAVWNDVILIDCGTYHEFGIQVKPGISLWSGTLQPDCVTIDAGGRGRILYFNECDSTTNVAGVTLRNGRSDGDGGAILCRNSSPRLTRVNFVDNQARRGGGLASVGSGGPRLTSCVITDNQAALQGGGVYWDAGGEGGLDDCTLQANRALAGGGLAAGPRADGLRVTATAFLANEAEAAGGGVWLRGSAPIFDRCVFAGNLGALAGGAVACRGGQPRLGACTLADNRADSAGGVMLIQNAVMHLERTILAFNRGGAAAGSDGSRFHLSDCNVYGHAEGDWPAALAAMAAVNGNFSHDPAFCSPATGNYDLRRGSPCLPGGRDGAPFALVGARPLGCD